jgi:hypothetical protein
MSKDIAQQPETACTTANRSSESSAERERLELEKLRLDNEEQQARITQLGLKWWQRPKAIITMLVPLVPVVFAGIISFTGYLATEKIRAAEVEKKAAEVEKQNYQIENQRLVLVKERTLLENMRLRFEQKELKKQQERLNARISELAEAERRLVDIVFRRFTNITEIGGSIVTAGTYETASAAFHQFTAYEILGIDADLGGALDEIKKALKSWRERDLRPDSDLEDSVLRLSIACKAAFQKHKGEQFEEPVRKLTKDIYEQAQQLIEDLENSEDFTDAKDMVDRFWQLYYGKLVLVESKEVESVMVRAGNALRVWKEGPPNKILLKELSASFRHEYEKLLKPAAAK